MKNRKQVGLWLTATAAGVMFLGGAAQAAADCAGLAGTTGEVTIDAATPVIPPVAGSVETRGSYTPVAVDLPFCRVQGRIEGNIGFELWLPVADRWNRRMLGAGVGGDAGIFNFRDMSQRINEGFAVVSSDAGHKMSQARWMADPKARVDYEHRAVHLTAEAAKAIVARYYGDRPDRAYFLGCSGGGRQGLKEMQNYPADYDGIVAGAPGPYMPLISVRMMWSGLLQKAAPEAALREEDWALYEMAVTGQCDAQDGVADGIIENPLRCTPNLARLACQPGQVEGCLTAPRLAMLERLIAPMPDETGKPMDKGMLAGVRTRPGPPSPLLRAMWADAVYNDPDWNADGFRRTDDLAAVNRVMPELRADKTDIRGFVARGGKAIIYQGWQDPSVSAGPTVDYYKALSRANGGMISLSRNVRLMMVPGMYHCRGGPGADVFGGSTQAGAPGDPQRDILWSVINWVEKGVAPDSLEATRPARAGLSAVTRRLCAAPAIARPIPGANHDSATGFECRTDVTLVAN